MKNKYISVKVYRCLMSRTNINLERHHEFKSLCAQEGKSMVEVINGLIRDYMDHAKLPCADCGDIYYPTEMYQTRTDKDLIYSCTGCWHGA